METTMKLRIPSPCQESWNNMSLASNGRHCGVCQKTVIDFTNKSPEEIKHYFQHAHGRTCGRFDTQQLGLPNNALHRKLLTNYRRMESAPFSRFSKAISLSMLSLAIFLVSCDWMGSNNRQVVGDTVYVEKADTTQLKKSLELDSTKTSDTLHK